MNRARNQEATNSESCTIGEEPESWTQSHATRDENHDSTWQIILLRSPRVDHQPDAESDSGVIVS